MPQKVLVFGVFVCYLVFHELLLKVSGDTQRHKKEAYQKNYSTVDVYGYVVIY